MMFDLRRNLCYALRVLRKSPAFSSVAIISLAMGIGANTAIFTLINALLLRDLPVRNPEQLVELSAVRQDNKMPFSYPMFQDVERGQRVFSDLFGLCEPVSTVQVNGVLWESDLNAVTGNYFSALGATPLVGRLLTSEDVNPRTGSAVQVAVISYEFWQQRFGSAPDVVGKQIGIERKSFTVVGVTPKWFRGLRVGEPPDITIPITAYPLLQDEIKLDTRSMLWVRATGRLKDGVTLEQARAQLQSFWPAVLLATASTETPGLRRQTFLSMRLDVASVRTGFNPDLRSRFTRPLYILWGMVGLILVVACVNMVNLMLARAAARVHEMSVRAALGATRWALVSQTLTETLVVSFGGAFLGLAFSYWGSRLLVGLMTEGDLTPVTLDLRPDLRVLALTVGVAVTTGVLIALIPAWRSSRQAPGSALQQGSYRMAGATGNAGRALIVTQIALSIVLLLGSGLLVRTFQKLRSIQMGFEKDRLLEIALNPKPDGYRNLNMNAYHRELTERISGLPGVRSVTMGPGIPGRDSWKEVVSVQPGDPTTAVTVMTAGLSVWPGFFETLGLPVVRGRDFKQADDERHPKVAIISRSLAKRLFPEADAIGKNIRFGFMPEFQSMQIVGVAEDARILNPREAAPPVFYFSSLQFPSQSQYGNVWVRTGASPEALEKTVSQEIDSLGHEYAIRTHTIDQLMSLVLVNERVIALLSGFFAGLALLLACIGLYGLMSYAVTQRTREIGIRAALGAQQRNILWIVLRETTVLAMLGIAIGIPCGLAATRLIDSMLYGVSANDVATLGVVSLLLLGVALVAGYLPARRAAGIDPLVALRAE